MFRFADIRQESVEWLWSGRIPIGSLTILDGDPSQGKTLLSLDLAARLSTGSPMPLENHQREAANVLLAFAEDSASATIAPKLAAAGANLQRVFGIDSGAFSLLDRLNQLVSEVQPRLIVIDPLSSFLRKSSSSEAAVRSLLEPLADLAKRSNAAVLIVRHLTKASGRNPLFRGTGSVAVAALARSALMLGVDRETNERVLSQTKSSLGPVSPSLAFSLEVVAGVPVVRWKGTTERRADEVMDNAKESSALQEAMDLLLSILIDTPVPARQVKDSAQRNGVANATLRRAKDRLGIESIRKGFGIGSVVYWTLPDKMPNQDEQIRREKDRVLDEVLDDLTYGGDFSPFAEPPFDPPV